MKLAGFLLIAGLIITSSTGVTPSSKVFLSEPASVNATIDSTATFTCNTTSSAILLEWTINGTEEDFWKNSSVLSVEPDIMSSSMRHTILYVPATTVFNNSEVVCVTGEREFGVSRSTPATLKVQGLLDPPPSLHIIDGYPHRLQWDAPFTLDITDVDPDISGYTICSNVTTQCINVTEEFFQFPSLCSPILFSVSAHNIIGNGAVSTTVYHPSNTEGAISGVLMVKVYFSYNNIVGVNFTLKVDKCFNFDWHALIVHLHTNQTVVDKELEGFPMLDEMGRMSFIVESNSIPHNEVLRTTITDGYGNYIASSIIKTYDLADAVVETNHSMIIITCYFTPGSVAPGCCVTLTPSDMEGTYSSMIAFRNVSQQELTVSFTDVEEGTYNISVHTLNDTGTCSSEGEIYIHFKIIVSIDESGTESSSATPTSPVTSSQRVTVIAASSVIGVCVLCLAHVLIVSLAVRICKYRNTAQERSDVHTYEDVSPERPTEPLYEEVELQSTLPATDDATHAEEASEIEVKECPAYRPLRRIH